MSKEAKIGLFAIAAIAVGIWGFKYIMGDNLLDRNSIKVSVIAWLFLTAILEKLIFLYKLRFNFKYIFYIHEYKCDISKFSYQEKH